jgi:hypothetical protein
MFKRILGAEGRLIFERVDKGSAPDCLRQAMSLRLHNGHARALVRRGTREMPWVVKVRPHWMDSAKATEKDLVFYICPCNKKSHP